MRNAFKRANYVLCLLLALSGTSCINRLNDEIKEGSILISFSFETSKAATKVTKNTFDIGDRSGIFAMLTGNSWTSNDTSTTCFWNAATTAN